jgi:predicted AlkP superfamily phosphohydrolase/phosphomutase
MRTLLVGLDAACRPVLDPLFAADAVPTLERLVREGASGPLTSQVPPWTASAWPSLYTGMNPGKHGVFDFLAFDGYDWDVVNMSHVRERTLWEYADAAGLTSVVVNAPVTDPPRPVDGAVLPGYLAPEEPTCHPEGILADVREAVGDYRVYARRETDARAADEKYDDYVRLSHLRGEAFRYLADRFDPDFGFLQFQKTDAVFHDFPGDRDKVRGVYEAVDEEVAATIDACDPDVVVVASDHGMGEYDGYEVRVNELLRREGFLEAGTDGDDVPSWFRIKDERLVDGDGGDGDGDGDGRSLLERLATVAASGGLTYQRGKAILERVGLADFVGRHVPVGAVFAASESVSFAESRASLRSVSELGVRLNVAGRDPDGVVPADDYDAVRAAVREFLAGVETPDGDPVFEEVVPRERYLHGPYADDAVDLLCVPAGFDHSLSMHVGDPFGDPEPWNHKREGIVAVSGDVAVDAGVAGAHLFDVAPTVLATLGIAPNERMDGDPLPPVAGPPAESYPDFDAGDRVGTGDEAVTARLEDLGYLE